VEALEQGTERRPRSRRSLVLLLIGLLGIGVLVAGGLYADARWRANAAVSLTIAFDKTVSAIEIAERRVQSVSEYARPARGRADLDPSVRESLDALVRDAAIESSAVITERRAAVDDVLLLPWHSDLRHAQAQAGVWLDLRATGINSFAAQGEARYPPRGELNDARAALVRAFSTLN